MRSRKVGNGPVLSMIALCLVGALGGTILAAASTSFLKNDSVDTIFAERLDVESRFEVFETRLVSVAADAPAVGTKDAPLEMTEIDAPGWTALHAGDWAYVVGVRERAPASVTQGVFAVTLTVDSVAKGTAYIVQNVSDPALAEGARLTIDVGAVAPVAPLLVVTVSEVRTDVTPVGLKVVDASSPNGQYQWQGVGGTIDGLRNPNMTGHVGQAFLFTISVSASDDPGHATHNLTLVFPWNATTSKGRVTSSSNIDAVNNPSTTLSWTPTTAGTYRYECPYHKNTQHGYIDITS